MEENSGKKTRNRNLLVISLVILIFVLVLFATSILGLFSKFDPDVLSINNSPVLGDPNAPVTIYEFSDFSCPYCAAASGENPAAINALKNQDPLWEAPLISIKEKYVKEGKVKIVFKYYPGHGNGKAAHLVGWALNEQNLFWKFHDEVFKQQEDTSDLVKMKETAQKIGANMTLLEITLASKKYDNQFELDTEMGKAAGIKGTPTFFINDKKIEGAQSAAYFNSIIEEELKNKNGNI